MKDERLEDVKEFIDYHRWVGVDTFYLRENGDECAIEKPLQPYADAGILDLGLLPGEKHPAQTNWFNDCSREASRSHSWVAFVDLDEFMVVLDKCALNLQSLAPLTLFLCHDHVHVYDMQPSTRHQI